MDLETLNKEYIQLKEELQKVYKEIEFMENRSNDLADDKIIAKANLIVAKRKSDIEAQRTAEEEITRIDSEIKSIKENLFYKKEELGILQVKINVRVEELKKNSQFKEIIKEEMLQKCNDKLSQYEEEKEELLEKKDRVINLKQIITKHPVLNNNLKKILQNTMMIKDLKQELESIKRWYKL